MKELLSPSQKRLLSIAVTFLAIVTIYSLIGLTLSNLGSLLNTFSKIVWPLAIASICAFILRPIVDYAESRFKFSPAISIILLYVLLVVCIAAFFFFAIPPLIDQLITFIHFIPKLTTQILTFLEGKFPTTITTLKTKISDIAFFKDPNVSIETFYSYFPKVLEIGTNIVAFFGWITALATIPIYLFYILNAKDSSFIDRLETEISFVKRTWRNDVIFLLNQYSQILESFFRGQLLIGFIMGILYALGFFFIGLQFAFLLGITIGLLNIIPYLGTIIGLASVIPIAFFQENGSWVLAALALTTFIVVQIIEGYFLTPKIMGKRTGLHPMTIIISIFFWGIVFDGILGMILAIPLTASLIVTWYLIKKKYLSTPAH